MTANKGKSEDTTLNLVLSLTSFCILPSSEKEKKIDLRVKSNIDSKAVIVQCTYQQDVTTKVCHFVTLTVVSTRYMGSFILRDLGDIC